MSVGYPPDFPNFTSPYDLYENPSFTRGMRRILEAIIEAFMPRNERFQLELTKQLRFYLERWFTYLPRLLLFALPLGLYLVEYLALFLYGRRFSRLSPEKRLKYLEKLRLSRFQPLRELHRAMRALVYLAYYEHPRVLELLGFDHSAHARRMIQLRKERYGLDVA
jgi:hypothetical protein